MPTSSPSPDRWAETLTKRFLSAELKAGRTPRETATEVGCSENTVRDYLARRMEGRPLYPNVDFFSASVYKMLGIPADLYTPIFACQRISGWTAHLIEQYADNRLMRPNALYEGEENRKYAGVADR